MFTKIKSLLMVLILAGFTAQYAAAESFNQEDMAFAFGDSAIAASDFGQMDLLSSQEMVETEGEFYPFLVAGYYAYRGFQAYRYANIGVRSAWIRVGKSYSSSNSFKTYAIRWGSNSHWRNQIGSSRLRNFNARLHNTRIPVNSWRTRDPGHFHLWRR
jgi:hypothetical protein